MMHLRRWVRPGRPAKALLCLLLTLGAAEACGPDFSPDVFVLPQRPDLPSRYVQGRLGLLQPSFARVDLLIAYRYLGGGTLDLAEQKSLQTIFGPGYQQGDTEAPDVPQGTGIAHWVLARGQYPGAPPGPIGQERTLNLDLGNGDRYQGSYLNCADDAFATAAATLRDRATRWGSSSPALKDWLQAQDAVFANCTGGPSYPAPALPGGPALLVQDRAYQLAAANFYSLALPAARAQFAAIEQDKGSPWQPLAGYLVARTMVRQAFFARRDTPAQASDGAPRADYDPALMDAAARQLRSYLDAGQSSGLAPSLRQAAEAELAFVTIRSEPEQRARELSLLVGGFAGSVNSQTGPKTGSQAGLEDRPQASPAGPQHDPRYAQDLVDLLWYIDAKTPNGLRAGSEPYYYAWVPDEQHPGQQRMQTQAEADNAAIALRHDTYQATGPERALSRLIDWTLTFQSLDPAAGAHALDQWQRTYTLPWLVAALALAPENTAPPQPLLAAAAAVPAGSPGWQTATYHRIRLLLGAGDGPEARAVLAQAMPKILAEAEPSSVNAFRGLALRASPTLAGFLEYAPRRVLLATSEERSSLDECQTVMKDSPSRHYECIAEASPNQLDRDAAGVLNGQAPLRVWLAAAESPALGQQLRQAVAMGGWTRAVLLHDAAAAAGFLPLLPEALRAQASAERLGPLLVLARNPGLNPYLNAGIQRSYSYDFVESYRDNWCYKSSPSHPVPAEPAPAVAFLDEADRKAGVQQAQALAALRSADVGQQIVDYVRDHPGDRPGDQDSAEALFLVLRMIRYGCTEPAPPPRPSSPPGAGPSIQVVEPSGTWSIEALQLLKIKQEAARLLRRRYPASPWTRKAAPFAG
jgi:hypothetical protein